MKAFSFLFGALFLATGSIASASNHKTGAKKTKQDTTQVVSLSSLSQNWIEFQDTPAEKRQKEITKINYTHQATAMIARSLEEQASN